MSDPIPEKNDPNKKFAPIAAPSLVRRTIINITDTIPALKSFVAANDKLPDGLKSYIATELDLLKSNAAEINLHDVAKPEGGFDLHISVKEFHLGQRVPVAKG